MVARHYRARFNSLLRQNIGTVKRYKQYFEEQNPNGKFNAYTVIRHCLYLGNKDVFGQSAAQGLLHLVRGLAAGPGRQSG